MKFCHILKVHVCKQTLRTLIVLNGAIVAQAQMKGGFLQSSKGLGGPDPDAAPVAPGKARWTAETLQTVVKIMLIQAYGRAVLMTGGR